MSGGRHSRLVGIALVVLAVTGALMASTGTAQADQGPITPVAGDYLRGLSCPPTATAASTCLAVGDTDLVAVQGDGTKVATPVAVTSVGSDYDLTAVSCPSSSLCVVVGVEHGSGDTTTGFALPFDPTGKALGDPTTLPVLLPHAISCASPTSCGVGGDDGDNHAQTTTLALSGTTITANGSVGTIAGMADVTSISCDRALSCSIGGDNLTGPQPLGLLATAPAGTSSTAHEPDANGTVTNISAVGCGVYLGENSSGVSEIGTLPDGTPHTLGGGQFEAITTLDTTHCLAVGNAKTKGVAQEVSPSEISSAPQYRPDTAPQYFPGTTLLAAVACTTTSLCAAVGQTGAGGAVVAAVSPDGSYTGAGATQPCNGPPALSHTFSIVGVASFADGYLLTDAAGDVISCGDAPDPAPPPSHLAAPIVGIAAARSGHGYDLVAADGGVFSYDGARFEGSAGNLHLRAPVVGIAVDPLTDGYWLAAADGGVFNYGTPFAGSAGNLRLKAPVVGIAANAGGEGYWLAAADGGVFNYDAPFDGSAGNLHLNAPVVGIAPSSTGGYRLAAADGGIFNYGAGFAGSAAGLHLQAPVVGIAGDYVLAGADGGVFNYGSAPFEGSGTAIVLPLATTQPPVIDQR